MWIVSQLKSKAVDPGRRLWRTQDSTSTSEKTEDKVSSSKYYGGKGLSSPLKTENTTIEREGGKERERGESERK